MKRVIGKVVYLQGYEVGFILNQLYAVPGSIMTEVFDGKRTCCVIAGREANIGFDWGFKKANSNKWLLGQDWILDYDEYKDKPVKEIKTERDELYKKYTAGIDEFNAKDKEYRNNHYEECNDKFNKICHKLESLDMLIYYLEHGRTWPR